MRRAGIDEAGYGPNLGPLVMTAVIAEGPSPRAHDVWMYLEATVARSVYSTGRVGIDDSQALLRGPHARSQLEATCRVLLTARSGTNLAEDTLPDLLASGGGGTLVDVELTTW